MEKWKEANANKEKNEPQIPKVPERFWEDGKWAEENYGRLQKRYFDVWVAVFNKNVVSSGKDIEKVEVEAEKKTKTSSGEIPLIFIERGAHVYQSEP